MFQFITRGHCWMGLSSIPVELGGRHLSLRLVKVRQFYLLVRRFNIRVYLDLWAVITICFVVLRRTEIFNNCERRMDICKENEAPVVHCYQ